MSHLASARRGGARNRMTYHRSEPHFKRRRRDILTRFATRFRRYILRRGGTGRREQGRRRMRRTARAARCCMWVPDRAGDCFGAHTFHARPGGDDGEITATYGAGRHFCWYDYAAYGQRGRKSRLLGVLNRVRLSRYSPIIRTWLTRFARPPWSIHLI